MSMNLYTLDINNFSGLTTKNGSTQGNILQVANFEYGPSKNGSTLFHGFVTKSPDKEVYGDTVGTSYSLGLHLFVPSISALTTAFRYLQGFSDGTVRWNSSGTWTTITSSLSLLPVSFSDFNYLDRVFYTNGREAPQKWGRDWIASKTVQNKSGTAVALTGTITFTNGNTAITGVGTAFTTECPPGTFIRRDTTDDWCEVIVVTDNTNLVLNSEYLNTTGAGALGGSQKAALTTIRARYTCFWNDRLFLASGDISGLPIVGVALCDALGTPLP